jgi:tight adherence protein B
MGRRLSAREDPQAVSAAVLRLAVLLQGGLAPARAWRHLADAGDAAAARVVEAMEEGVPMNEAVAVAGAGWRDVAAAFRVATTVGAPLSESLRGVAIALRDAQEAADDVRVALAEPAGTARLMGWLPIVAVGLGAILGFDTFGVLFTHPAGIACLLLGVALIVAAQRWNARLVRRARAAGGVPGLEAELLAIALSGGVSIDRAKALVRAARAMPAVAGATAGGGVGDDAEHRAPDGVDADRFGVDEVLALSRAAGVPAVELLRATAAHARHRARIRGRLRAARLSSRLLIPLGVCTLPAFLLLGVAPMLLSVVKGMPLSL